VVELGSRHLLYEVWAKPMTEFYKRYKRLNVNCWSEWGLGIGGYVRFQKASFEIGLNLLFVDFYFQVWRNWNEKESR
jgi:hypothetical protein